jgi:hypothetical protein
MATTFRLKVMANRVRQLAHDTAQILSQLKADIDGVRAGEKAALEMRDTIAHNAGYKMTSILTQRPRDSDDQDPYDEAYDSTEDPSTWVDPREADDDELKLKLDLQEDGLSREQILKYSVRHRLYPSSYVLTYFRHLTVMDLAA